MQAKDVADRPVLEFVAGLDMWGTWFGGERGNAPPYNSVLHAMPEGTSEKVALAKMRALIRRGLVDGCTCGCRGDYEITEKGRAWLAALLDQQKEQG